MVCNVNIDNGAGLAGRSKDRTTSFDSLSENFNAQLPPFVQAMMPFVLTARYGTTECLAAFQLLLPWAVTCYVICGPIHSTVCRSGVDKADVETFRTLLWRLDTAKQAASFNEQKHAAYIKIEYLYLQYTNGLRKGLSGNGLHSSFYYGNFLDFGDLTQFAGKELWPSFLSQVAVVYQQPIYDMQKRFMSSIK